MRLNVRLAIKEEVAELLYLRLLVLYKEVKVRKYGMGVIVSGGIRRMACMETAILNTFRLYNIPLSKAYFSWYYP